MRQTPLLLTLVTRFTGILSTVNRNRYRLLAGHLYRTGLVSAPAQPSSPSGETVLTRLSRPHPAQPSSPGSAVLAPARSAPPRPSEPGCARPGQVRTRACR